VGWFSQIWTDRQAMLVIVKPETVIASYRKDSTCIGVERFGVVRSLGMPDRS
jgi:hypothetical protein